MSEPNEVDPARQLLARRYAGQRRWLGLLGMGLGVVYLAAIFAVGVHLHLRDGLIGAGLAAWQPIQGWSPLLIGVNALLFTVVYTLITFPLSIYGGFTLPRRYGLSKQSLGGWLGDQAKGLILNLIFLLGAVEVIYLLLATQPQTWWIWVGVILLFFTVILVNLAPVLLLPLFYKFQPMPDGELRSRLLAMADRAHTRVNGVYVMAMSQKTTEGNAAVMGLGNTRRIVVGDTIITEFTLDEVEVVLAHELGHQVHNDVPKLIAAQTLLTFGGLALVNVGLHAAMGNTTFGFTSLADVATMPLLVVLLGLYSIITGPLGNTYSRMVERQADQYALEMTRNPASFISAFHRLANQNLAQLEPSPIIEALFYDHPAIGKRILHAKRWAAQAVHPPSGQQ